MFQCYSCDSNQGECDDEHAGSEIDCPVESGCTINKSGRECLTGTKIFFILILDSDLFVRGCSVDDGPGCKQDGVGEHIHTVLG